MTLYHACFSSIERIGFSQEYHLTLFQCVLKCKTKYEKISYFWPESWVGISSIKGRYNMHVFLVQKGLFSFESLTKYYFKCVWKFKTKYKKKISHLAKIMGNAFGKSPIYWLDTMHAFGKSPMRWLDTMHAFRVKKGSLLSRTSPNII